MKRRFLTLMIATLFLATFTIGCGKNQEAVCRDSENYSITEETIPLEATLQSEKFDTSRYYYNQLTEESKLIYDKVINSKEDFIENRSVVVGSIDGEHGLDMKKAEKILVPAINAYYMDNPESTMWINGYAFTLDPIIKFTDDGDYDCIERFDIIIQPMEQTGKYADFESPEETRAALEKINQLTEEFVKNLSGSDEEKLKAIHDWILKDATYDETKSKANIRNVYGALVQKDCVCAGFAYAFKYVADAAGLQVITVTGEGFSGNTSEPHAWNLMYCDEKWTLTDVTWDVNGRYEVIDEKVETEEYIDENGNLVVIESYTPITEKVSSYSYFAKPLEETTDSHIPDEMFEIPSK